MYWSTTRFCYSGNPPSSPISGCILSHSLDLTEKACIFQVNNKQLARVVQSFGHRTQLEMTLLWTAQKKGQLNHDHSCSRPKQVQVHLTLQTSMRQVCSSQYKLVTTAHYYPAKDIKRWRDHQRLAAGTRPNNYAELVETVSNNSRKIENTELQITVFDTIYRAKFETLSIE